MVIKTELAKIEFTVCPVNQLTEKSDWQIPWCFAFLIQLYE